MNSSMSKKRNSNHNAGPNKKQKTDAVLTPSIVASKEATKAELQYQDDHVPCPECDCYYEPGNKCPRCQQMICPQCDTQSSTPLYPCMNLEVCQSPMSWICPDCTFHCIWCEIAKCPNCYSADDDDTAFESRHARGGFEGICSECIERRGT